MLKILIIFMLTVLIVPGFAQVKKVIVTAHRGASGYAPENTLSAIKTAIDMRADYAEIDVQETSDGEIILLHDSNLARTTGFVKNIRETDYNELKTLDAGSWFGDNFNSEPIPKLQDVIDSIRGKIKLNIELKTYGQNHKLAEITVKIVKNKKFQVECIFTSFEYSQIKRVKEIDSKLKTGLIFSKVPLKQNVFKSDFEVLSVHYSLVDSVFMEKANAAGKEVHVWTVNDEAEMKRLIKLSVTSIITNYPDKLKQLLEK